MRSEYNRDKILTRVSSNQYKKGGYKNITVPNVTIDCQRRVIRADDGIPSYFNTERWEDKRLTLERIEYPLFASALEIAQVVCGKQYTSILNQYYRAGFDFGDLRAMVQDRKKVKLKVEEDGEPKAPGMWVPSGIKQVHDGDFETYLKGVLVETRPNLVYEQTFNFSIRRAVGLLWLSSLLGEEAEYYIADSILRFAQTEGLFIEDANCPNPFSILDSISEIYKINVDWSKIRFIAHEKITFNNVMLSTTELDPGNKHLLSAYGGYKPYNGGSASVRENSHNNARCTYLELLTGVQKKMNERG